MSLDNCSTLEKLIIENVLGFMAIKRCVWESVMISGSISDGVLTSPPQKSTHYISASGVHPQHHMDDTISSAFTVNAAQLHDQDQRGSVNTAFIHFEDGWYFCPFCETKCIEKSKVRRHMRRHTGERPFKCTMCSYSATQNNNLKRHVATVHGVVQQLSQF